MGTKKLIVLAGILAAALAGACGGRGAPHRLGAYGPAPAPFLSLQNVNGAQPGYQGVAQITSVNGQLYYSPPDGGFAPVGSGSGGGLTPVGANTTLCNNTNDAGLPVGCTVSQELTMLGVTPFNDARASALIRAQALLGATASVITGSEFGSSADVSSTGSAGGGTVTVSTGADKGGVALVSTASSASSQAMLRMAGTPTGVDNFRTSKWYAYWRAAVSTAIDANTQASFSVGNFAGNSDIDVGVRGAASTANWAIFFRDPSGATIRSATATAVAIDTNYHDWEIWNDGTNFNIAIDGNSVYTTLVSGTAGTEAGAHWTFVANSATAAARTAKVDRVWFVTSSN